MFKLVVWAALASSPCLDTSRGGASCRNQPSPRDLSVCHAGAAVGLLLLAHCHAIFFGLRASFAHRSPLDAVLVFDCDVSADARVQLMQCVRSHVMLTAQNYPTNKTKHNGRQRQRQAEQGQDGSSQIAALALV